MDKRIQITFQDVLAHSGIHPKILHFAEHNGFRPAPSDQTLDERAARLRRSHPEMDHKDVLVMLGGAFNDEVTEFFNQAFPIVE